MEEAVRRLSLAYTSKEPFSSVKIKNSKRTRRVCLITGYIIAFTKLTTTLIWQWQRMDSRFYDKEWTEEEVKLFEKGLEYHHGAELGLIKGEIKTRSVPEIVRFYGHWKK